MIVVVDANPLISLLIKPGKPLDLLLQEDLELVAPAWLFEEIEKYKELVYQKSGLEKGEADIIVSILKKRIRVVMENEFVSFRERAEKVCPDGKDVPYFALALYLRCALWSNDKRLKEQSVVVVYATHELMDVFHLR